MNFRNRMNQKAPPARQKEPETLEERVDQLDDLVRNHIWHYLERLKERVDWNLRLLGIMAALITVVIALVALAL